MKTYLIFDIHDDRLKHGFYMQVENVKGARRNAVKKAKESGMCKFYGIEKPVAFAEEEVNSILSAR